MTTKGWEEITDAVEDLSLKPSISRIEGNDHDIVEWKVYRVTGDIIRIDIKPKERT